MYRLTENVYARDDKGVLRLTERVPVSGPVRQIDGRWFHFFAEDAIYCDDITDDLAGDHPRYTLTQHEDPMHTDCGPCDAGLPEETHSAPETKLKTVAKTILLTLAAAVAAAFMRMC